MEDKVYRAWHLAPADLMTVEYRRSPRMPIIEGQTLEMTGSDEPLCGQAGMHASTLLLDALEWIQRGRPNAVCWVDVWGDVDERETRLAGRYRKTVRIIPQHITEREFRLFAADMADRWLRQHSIISRMPPEAWDVVKMTRRHALGEVPISCVKEAIEKLGCPDFPFFKNLRQLQLSDSVVAVMNFLESTYGIQYLLEPPFKTYTEYLLHTPKNYTESEVVRILSQELENRLLAATGQKTQTSSGITHE